MMSTTKIMIFKKNEGDKSYKTGKFKSIEIFKNYFKSLVQYRFHTYVHSILHRTDNLSTITVPPNFSVGDTFQDPQWVPKLGQC